MNQLSEIMKAYKGSANMSEEEFIAHYGVGHLDGGHSGRFPWGSGKDPYQGYPIDFISRIQQLKSEGWKETTENIKNTFNLSTSEYRQLKSIAADEVRKDRISRAKRLVYDPVTNPHGHSVSEVARRMGVNESNIREWLKADEKSKLYATENTVKFLKEQLKEKKMLDVGERVAEDEISGRLNMGISREKLDTALYVLKKQGYHVYEARVPQATNKDKYITMKVLTVPEIKNNKGTTPKEVYQFDKIGTINDYITKDNGTTFEKKFTYPTSLDSRRLLVLYADDKGPDGYRGVDKDGIVELRRGVQDLDLGNSRYAQVRILVDGTHYIKGMAVYSDNMPPGIDVIFNTNKKRDKCPTPKDCLKEIKNDPDNPFGSAIKDADQGGQYWYIDKKDGKKKLGLINKRADEGDWSEWKNGLPSQFLSKQSRVMAQKQLELAKLEKEEEFSNIMALENPTVKRYFLNKFASECDGAAVDLKAASLPGQHYHVIIPVNSMGDNKVYAPQYKDGTKLALIRYPHGGRFEIPILTVDSKNPLARKIIPPDSIDAIGISSNVASQLSGADFDGDTVMCIPTHDRQGRVKILNRKPFDELRNFDTKTYQYHEAKPDKNGKMHYYRNGKEFPIMKNTNLEMGKISNLISDMTLFGAAESDETDLIKAVKHSMVVIDAEKHKLDYKQSEADNNIDYLKRKWQRTEFVDGKEKIGGASTIISRAKSPYDVPKRRGEPRVNIKGKDYYDPTRPEGSLIYFTAYDSDRYYAEGSYDKKTGTKTLVKTDGKKIHYNMKDAKEREKYEPIMRKDKDGSVYFTNKDGSIEYRTKERTTRTTKMDMTDDARTLYSKQSSPHPMEVLYADYANSMKSLANRCRLESNATGRLKYSSSAAKIYANEVDELKRNLNAAKSNKIRERTAQRYAAVDIRNKREENPDLKGEDLRKAKQRSISKYREMFGAVPGRKRNLQITDKQWEAIQAGAVSDTLLSEILENSDPDILREKAMPKNNKKLSQAQINRIKAMGSNFTIVQIAEIMHIPKSTVSNVLKGEK